MIAAYNQERLARLQADTETQQQSIALPDKPTTEITLPDKPTTAIAQPETTDQQTHKDKGEDELFTKRDLWKVGKVVETYVEYIKEAMLKGVDVIIQDINVLSNEQLVHNWGTLVREELAGKVATGTMRQLNKYKQEVTHMHMHMHRI